MSQVLDDLRAKLAATLAYGEEIAKKLKDPNLGPAMRADYEAELEAVEERAKSEAEAVEAQERVERREERINSIGVRAGVIKPLEEQQAPTYRDPVEALFRSEAFGEFVDRVRAGDWNASTPPIEFKAAAVDVTDEPAGNLVTTYVPGIARLDYTFPTEVGALFSQGTMTGSNVTYLKRPGGATGAAEYQATLGAQKGGTFAMTLDVGVEYAKTVAAVATIPSQNLDDIPALEGEVRAVLLQGPNGIAEKLEDAYINGAGGSSEIQGILDLSPEDSTLAGDYVSKSIFKAAADIKAATGFTADAVVVNPDEWFTLSTEVGTEDNRPLFGAWGTQWGQNGVGPRIVVSRKIPSGTILVGAFKASTRYVRQAVTIAADASGLGLRDKNLVLFVAEARELLLHRYGADPYRTVTVSS